MQSQVEYTAPVHIEMLGPYGYISATDFPFLPVNNKIKFITHKICNQVFILFAVLRHNVRCLCHFWHYMAGGVIHAMA